MDEREFLADRFEASRSRLKAVAYRMLGSASEAEDAVQETWIRLSRAGSDEIDNLTGWLTTVVSRVCLDMLRARQSRREAPFDAQTPEPSVGPEDPSDEERRIADTVGTALLVVLDKLAPAERVAFVLHDMFGLPFDDIAAIVGRTPAAARQLASRARRRVRGAEPPRGLDRNRQRRIAEAFLLASRNGDLAGLLAVLDPDVVMRSDRTAVQMGGAPELHGAAAVAAAFKGRAQAARPALVDGALALVVAFGGRLRIVVQLTFASDRIASVSAIADSDQLGRFEIVEFSD